MAVAASTSGLYTLSITKVSAIPVPLPPVEEQSQIIREVEERLSIAAKADEQIEADLRRADRLRQSILKRAFEGQLVPQDASDEPAERLLERIRAEREAAAAKNGSPRRKKATKRRAKK